MPGGPLTDVVFAALTPRVVDPFGGLHDGETMIGPLITILMASLMFGIGEPGWAVPGALPALATVYP